MSSDKGDYLYATLMQCVKCGIQYPIVPFFKAVMRHGPDKNCDGKTWVRVPDERVI